MRNRTLGLLALLLLVAGFFGVFNWKNYDSKKIAGTQLHPFVKTPQGKHLALVKVDVTALGPIPESSDEPVTLIGRILFSQNLPDGFQYKWHLPKGVHLIQGQKQGTLPAVKGGEIQEVTIQVQNFSSDLQRVISLHALVRRGEERLGGSGLIVTRPGETFESQAPQIREAVDAFHKQPTKKPRRF